MPVQLARLRACPFYGTTYAVELVRGQLKDFADAGNNACGGKFPGKYFVQIAAVKVFAGIL